MMTWHRENRNRRRNFSLPPHSKTFRRTPSGWREGRRCQRGGVRRSSCCTTLAYYCACCRELSSSLAPALARPSSRAWAPALGAGAPAGSGEAELPRLAGSGGTADREAPLPSRAMAEGCWRWPVGPRGTRRMACYQAPATPGLSATTTSRPKASRRRGGPCAGGRCCRAWRHDLQAFVPCWTAAGFRGRANKSRDLVVHRCAVDRHEAARIWRSRGASIPARPRCRRLKPWRASGARLEAELAVLGSPEAVAGQRRRALRVARALRASLGCGTCCTQRAR